MFFLALKNPCLYCILTKKYSKVNVFYVIKEAQKTD